MIPGAWICHGLPGLIALVVAFFLGIFTSISAPIFPQLDIVRVRYTGDVSLPPDLYEIIRFGIWGFCGAAANSGGLHCETKGTAYSVEMRLLNSDNDIDTVDIGGAWTGGLLLPIIFTLSIAVASGLSFTSKLKLLLVSWLLACFAIFMALASIGVNTAFLKHVEGKLKNYDMSVSAGPGFWLSVATLLIMLMGTTAVFLRFRQRFQRSTVDSDEAITWFPMAKLGRLPFMKKKLDEYEEFGRG